MAEQNGQPPVPNPQPVPMSFALDVIRSDQGVQLIRVSFVGPTGVFVTFFDADGAARFADQLKEKAAQAAVVLPAVPPIIRPRGVG